MLEFSKGYFSVTPDKQAERANSFVGKLYAYKDLGLSDFEFAHSITMLNTMLDPNEMMLLRTTVQNFVKRA